MMRIARPTVLLLSSVVLLAGLSPAASSAPLRASATAPPGISWGRCPTHELRHAGAQCGSLTVPLDFADPTGPTISLAVSRLRHTSSPADYQGVLISNSGGPGVPGFDNSLYASAFPQVAADYDWIGLDPRGVGRSTPTLSCRPHYFVGPRPPYTPSTPAIADQWLAKAAGYTKACAASDGAELMAHDSTVDWAHDVDALRLALGVSRITFYGFSYGTYLGQVYATLYPQHVRRMILDSNIDPRGDGLHVMLSMAGPVQRNLGFWFRWVARHHRTYHLGSTPAAVQRRFNATQRALAQRPAGGVVGPAEWVDVFFLTSFIQPDAYWPYLADVFQQWAVNHKAAPLVQAYEFNAEDTTGDNGYATFVAVRCMDSPWPTDWRTWRQRTWEQSHRTPFVAWGNSWFVMPCRTWPSSVTSRVDVDGHAVPALILDDRFDGSIAYSANLAVRSRFPNGSFVTVRRGIAHTDSFANPCEHRWVARYLAHGTLPQRLTGHRADYVCPGPGLPSAQ